MKFSEGRNLLTSCSIFVLYNYDQILAIAKIDSVDLNKCLKEIVVL